MRALLDSGVGISIYDIAARYDVTSRTALRYLQALQRAGEPLYEQMSSKKKLWRILPTAQRQTITLSTSQMAALFLSRRVFDFLAGTGFKEDDRKVFDVNEARHFYEGPRRRRERHHDRPPPRGPPARHPRERLRRPEDIRPRALHPVRLQEGPHLAGLSHDHRETRTFALDGFRGVDWLKGDHFEYPTGYRPERLTEGAFGLIRGESARVRIRFDPKVAPYVQRRGSGTRASGSGGCPAAASR